jgi:hypothetical protein
MKTKKLASIMLLGLLLVTLSSCGGNPLVGTWEANTFGITTTMEFKNDGTMTLSTLGFSIQAKYSVSGNQVTLTMENGYTDISSMPVGTSTFSISGDQLLMDGIIYKKVK